MGVNMDYKTYLDSYSLFVESMQWNTVQDDPMWGTVALTSEVGEFCQMVEKAKRKGNTYSKEEIMSELGDIMWNVTNLARIHGITLDEMMEYNVDKLSKRLKKN